MFEILLKQNIILSYLSQRSNKKNLVEYRFYCLIQKYISFLSMRGHF